MDRLTIEEVDKIADSMGKYTSVTITEYPGTKSTHYTAPFIARQLADTMRENEQLKVQINILEDKIQYGSDL